MKKLTKLAATVLVAGFLTVNVYAGCGVCGPKKADAPAAKPCGTSTKAAADKATVACPMGSALAAVKMTDEQKTKVDAAMADFRAKLATILTEEQMKKLSENCPGTKGCPAQK